MNTNIIEIQHLTKDYGNHKGIFDVSFHVKKGEVFGFLGPNGAGKTTTIRNLMGFIASDSGKCYINGLDCSLNSAKIQSDVGYIPGEIAFMDGMKASEFIKFMAEYRGLKDMTKARELIKLFDLNTNIKIKKMSKGMKQKLGIVVGLMHNPDILILDEPTSGLDPLMQNIFIDLINEEKRKGKTILLSSHSFEEVERTCSKVAIIKEGHIVTIDELDMIKSKEHKKYVITFGSNEDALNFSKEKLNVEKLYNNEVTIIIKNDFSHLIKVLSKYNVNDIDVIKQTLEERFLHYYGGESHD